MNASVLFGQLYYWQPKASSPLGVHKTVEELEAETGLTYEEQRTARRMLKALGVLVETSKRIEHKTYFRIDDDRLDQLLADSQKGASAGMGNAQLARLGKSISRNGESPSREMGKTQLANSGESSSRGGETLSRGGGNTQFVNEVKTTAETTAKKNPLTPLSPDKPTTQAVSVGKPKGTESKFERWWQTWPRSPRKVGKGDCEKRWQRHGLDAHAEVIIAHTAAMKLTRQWKEGFEPAPATYLNGQRWRDDVPPDQSELKQDGPSNAEWWESASGIEAKGRELGVEARAGEIMPDYLVRVAHAAGPGPWIDAVLKREQRSPDRYQRIVSFFGDKLMPVDWYA
ncbi:MAG: hypothetical protein ACTHJ1_09330 [Bordetella sp.]|uniref:hypothetical protein n=1 Tax=Bordetella sp. TaxID=28081 RepID=UPI003F7C6892